MRSGRYPRGRPKPAGGTVSLMKREMWDQLMTVIGTEGSSLAGAENESQLDQREDARRAACKGSFHTGPSETLMQLLGRDGVSGQ